MSWLEDTPMFVVQAHLDMMDTLKAEEAMLSATATAIGSRGMKPGHWMTNQWSTWRRVARRGVRPVKPKAGDLVGMGIGVRVMKNG